MDELNQKAEHAIARAKAKGATAADVMIRESDRFSVTVRMGDVETLKDAISRGLLLRVFMGKRTAASHTSDLSLPVIEQLVDETVEMARLTSEDQSGGLPDESLSEKHFRDLDLVDPEWESLTPDARIELARRAEAAALQSDQAIVNSEGGSFDYVRSRTVVANSLGFNDGYEGTYSALAATPIAQSNGAMQRDWWLSASRHRRNMETPEDVGRHAAARALRRLGARKIPTCEVPVIYDPMTARALLDDFFEAVAGDAIYRRTSFLVDKIGQTIAMPTVTVIDDGCLPAGLGSRPFDDEGVPSQTTPIIEDGVLKNYLHSSYSARKLSARPTGNATRAVSGALMVGPTNFYLKAGPYSPKEIIESVQSGLYLVELIGFGVNQVTGDYSRGAVGIWIENGKLTYPVQEVTIAGNLLQMLKDIEMIGNDLTFLGAVAAPTLKIRKMVISGE